MMGWDIGLCVNWFCGPFLTNSPADLHSKVLGPRHAGPIFFIFVMFSGKFGQIIGWHPLWEILNLPLQSVIESSSFLRRTVLKHTRFPLALKK